MKCKFAMLARLRGLWPLLSFLVAMPLAAVADEDPALTLTYIGNEAFMISNGKNGADGEPVLMTDFPYQSGYSVYMTYDPGYLDYAGDIVSLITHRHLDHVDPGLLNLTGWNAIGPRDALGALNPMAVSIVSQQADGEPETIQYGGIRVIPIRTEHSTTEHYSYLVEWRDKTLFLLGDTGTADALFQLDREVDIAFLTPWVLRPLLRDKKTIPARQIIVYHHTAIEDTPTCDKCLTPYQGQVIEVR